MRSQRDWTRYETILDGDQGGSVVTIVGPVCRSSTLDGFTIRNGHAESGGGIECGWWFPRIAHNTITGNRASSGGGNSCGGALIEGCTIADNNASNGSAIECSALGTVVAASTIVGSRGWRRAIHCPFGSSATIAGCVVAGNDTPAIFGEEGATLTVLGSTVAGNRSTGILCLGVGRVENSIVAFNSTGLSAPTADALVARSNCVYGNRTADYATALAGLAGTAGNFELDPLFLRPPSDGGDGWGDDPATPDIDEFANNDYGDLHLLAGSPCINAGDPAFVPAPDETDIDGQPRVLYGRVDIGVDEYGLPGDADYDAEVSVLDIVAVVTRFGHTPADPDWNPACDFDRDGKITVLDIVAVVTRFGERLGT